MLWSIDVLCREYPGFIPQKRTYGKTFKDSSMTTPIMSEDISETVKQLEPLYSNAEVQQKI